MNYSNEPLIECQYHGKTLRFYRKDKYTIESRYDGHSYAYLASERTGKSWNATTICILAKSLLKINGKVRN